MSESNDLWMYYDPNHGRMMALGSKKAVEQLVLEDMKYISKMHELLRQKRTEINSLSA